MPTLGNFTLFDAALAKIMNAAGPINLTSGTIKAVLTTNSQALSHSFVGASGNARYADLTAELATASGYTNGGVALSGLSIAGASNLWYWTAAPWSWTLSGSIVFKYCVLFDFAATNKDLLAFVDMDTGGTNITAVAGALQYTPGASGIFDWIQ
jgi:hypothetical protein